MKLTPWYPGTIKPVRVGIYQRGLPDSGVIVYSRWNGRFWLRGDWKFSFAKKQTAISASQQVKWRGVAK